MTMTAYCVLHIAFYILRIARGRARGMGMVVVDGGDTSEREVWLARYVFNTADNQRIEIFLP